MRHVTSKVGSGPRPGPVIVAIVISVALIAAFALVSRYMM
jgi:hypothetical protein